MKYPVLFLLLSILSFTHTAYGQNTLSARVTDHSGKPLAGAQTVLLDSSGMKLIQAVLTDSSGSFAFGPVKKDEYRLRVMLIGYDHYVSPKFSLSSNTVLPDITLTEQSLDEVVVTKQRPLIEVKSDKLVVNVENSIVSTGSTALEVLSRSPGVNVDHTESISLKGKQGVMVMVDGRLLPVSGTDLSNMLKNMPAESLDRIEIISNPSAKYDAEGNAGIINIVTKKGLRMGFNGSATGSYGRGFYHKANLGTNMNYRNEKLSVYGNYNYSDRKGFNHLVLTRRFYTGKAFESRYSKYDQDHDAVFPFKTHFFGAGIDYRISRRTTVGAGISGMRGTLNSSGIVTSAETDTNNAIASSFRTENTARSQWGNFSANAFLKHTLDSAGKEISADVDYAIYPSTSTQRLKTDYFNAEGTPSLPTYILKGDVSGYTQIQSLKTDYTHPVNKNLRLEAGIKTSLVKTDNEPVFYDISEADSPIYDTGKSNHYIYTENINAAYATAGLEKEKWGFKAGLRAEQTNIRGEQVITDQVMNNSYLKLFPSLSVQRNLSPKHDIGLTLSRRIQRPNYDQLNPFRYYMDPSTYTEGNPLLSPEISWSAEVSHTFKQQFLTSISYSYITDVITQVIQPVPGNITVQTTKNLAIMQHYNLSGAYPFQFYKWWGSMLNFNAYYSRYIGNLANTDLNKGMPAFDLNASNKFTLTKNTAAELSLNYNSPRLIGFMEMEAIWMLNLGVQQSILDKRGLIRLNATDIFWKGYPKAVSYYSNYNENFYAERDTRVVTGSFTYRFGKNTVAPVQKRQSGVEEEKSRVGG